MFFLNIPNILGNWADWFNQFKGILGYFWYYYLLKSCHCLSLVLISHFFLQKIIFTYTLQDCLYGIGIWFWAVDDLGYKANVSQENWVLCHVLR